MQLGHKYNSNSEIIVGKRACWTTLKNLVIRSAEQRWKKIERLINGYQSITHTKVAEMQAIIAGLYIQENNEQDHSWKATLGLLWIDEDFGTINLDPLFLPLHVDPLEEIKLSLQECFMIG